MLKFGNMLINTLLALAAVIVLSVVWLKLEIRREGVLPENKIVYIAPNSSTISISNKLFNEKVIDSEALFIIAAKIKGRYASLKAGEYEFSAKSSIKDVIEKMQRGEFYQRKITLPEGLTSYEVVELLNANDILQNEVKEIPPEGTLLPDTYVFYRGDTKQSIIERMQKALDLALDEAWQNKTPDLIFKDKAELLTLASIVEKETAVAPERAKIAGVFLNRLRIGMALQTDPTVIYALTQGKGKLERALVYDDLKIDSPYNTYVVKGLPPTAICNVGREALMASARPEQSEYIYFVADGTGGHVFAKTLEEHNKNVLKWRKIEKEQK